MTVDVAIVGAGASGLLTAIHLLRDARAPFRIALIEKAERVGDGIAYSTRRPEHLLNVTAGRMSAFDDDADHFVRYLDRTVGHDASDHAVFAQRKEYSDYLRATFDEVRGASLASIELIRDDVVNIAASENVVLSLRSGQSISSRRAVLALGNWPRANLLSTDSEIPLDKLLLGWNFDAVGEIDRDDDVLIAGSGLSMVDAVLTLANNAHAGEIHVVSRHGLFPLSHAPYGRLDLTLDELCRLPLRARLRRLRAVARAAATRGEPWQWLMDTLRMDNVRLWRTLSADDQRRFLRHASRYWDVHRHRIAPAAAAVVGRLLQTGQLCRHRGRVESVVAIDDRLKIRITGDGPAVVPIDRVIDCTGLQGDIRRVTNALVSSLRDDGIIRAGAHGIGIDTTIDGALIGRDGTASATLFTLGSARIGQLWESVAVPELRSQAAALSKRLSSSDNLRKSYD